MKPKEKTMTFGKEVELLFHSMTGKLSMILLKLYVMSLFVGIFLIRGDVLKLKPIYCIGHLFVVNALGCKS